jgi:transcription termination/antitermination protein NusG
MSAKWYIVHAYSNFEKKVADQIRDQAAMKGLSDQIVEVMVPTEQVTEVVRGRKRVSERRFFPGYVLVKMELSDATYHLIKDTPKVTGFLGAEGGKKPTPVSEREVKQLMGSVEEGAERPRATISFEIGEKVRVNEGPFQSFEGVVETVDEAKSRLKVTVSVFGRSTPVDLDYAAVEKL